MFTIIKVGSLVVEAIRFSVPAGNTEKGFVITGALLFGPLALVTDDPLNGTEVLLKCF